MGRNGGRILARQTMKNDYIDRENGENGGRLTKGQSTHPDYLDRFEQWKVGHMGGNQLTLRLPYSL